MKTLILVLVIGTSLPGFGAAVASGKLVLPKDLGAKAKGIRTVFISVQDPKAVIPMPCAAQKFTLEKDAEGEFLSFSLTTDSVMMMACTDLPETMNVKAKLDKDGDAGRDITGDIVGTVTGVKKGSSNLKITMEKVVQ